MTALPSSNTRVNPDCQQLGFLQVRSSSALPPRTGSHESPAAPSVQLFYVYIVQVNIRRGHTTHAQLLCVQRDFICRERKGTLVLGKLSLKNSKILFALEQLAGALEPFVNSIRMKHSSSAEFNTLILTKCTVLGALISITLQLLTALSI